MRFKGQYALEQLVIIALALTVIAGVFIVSMNFASDSTRIAQAKDTVEKIAKASDSVYGLGPGAKETLQLSIPAGTRFINTSSNRVHLRVSLSTGDTDVFAPTRGQLVGSVPIIAGAQEITITAGSNGSIVIGGTMLSCSPTSLTLSILQNGSANSSVTVTDSAYYNVTEIAASLSGILDIATIEQPSTNLTPGASTRVNISFSVAPSKTVGTYTGTLSVNGSGSSACHAIVTVIVGSSSPADITGPAVSGLSVTPASPNTTSSIIVNASGSDSTTGNSSIAYCELELDLSGIWNTMAPADGAYNSITEAVTYSIGTLSAGNHSARVRCADAIGNVGSPASSSTITVTAVGGGTVDSQGPLVSNIAIAPASPNTSVSINLTATGSDLTTGNNTVIMCAYSLDGGSWNFMTAQGGVYNAATINVSASLGNLSSGNHSASIYCNDSFLNSGAASNFSFNVTQVNEAVGPVVTYIGRTPSVATTITSITVNATGNDSATGGSNVSLCKISLDGGAYNSMTNQTGAWNNSVEENGTYSLGTLSLGSHTISVYCIDSYGNIGTAVNQSFNVFQGYTKSMLFISLTGSDTITESRWKTWINGHASNESLSWAYDNATVAAVANGSVSLTDYNVVVMGDAQSNNTNFWGKLNNFTATAHYVVLLGAAPRYGLYYMGAATANCSSENNRNVVPRTAHYVNSGYVVGTTYQIHAANNLLWYNTAFSGINVASTSTSSSRGLIIDDTAEFVLAFGDTRPDSFNAAGDGFATRVLDYALLNSG